jgi:hypothetical protein
VVLMHNPHSPKLTITILLSIIATTNHTIAYVQVRAAAHQRAQSSGCCGYILQAAPKEGRLQPE